MSTTYPSSAAAPRLLVSSAEKYQDLAARFGFYLLVLIACFSPWGDVTRFGLAQGSSDRGVTTVFAFGVIAISLFTFKFPAAIVARPRVLCFTVFVFIGTLASVLQNLSLNESFVAGINRGGYWILAVAVMSLNLNSERCRLFITLFAISTAAMCVVSLIDYFHIVNVPLFNEGYTSFRLDPEQWNTKIGRSMIGPFGSRSILGPYLALAWSVPLMELIHGKVKNPLRLAFWSGTFAILTLAIAVTYSRALYLTVLFGALYAVYSTGHRKVLRILFLVAPLLFLFFLVAQSRFPHEMEVLAFRLGSLSPDKFIESGGHYRVDAFFTTVHELLQNPLGMGFGLVQLGYETRNVHSVFTEHLRPAGVLGFLLTFAFAWPILKMIVSRHNSLGALLLCGALVGVLAYGLAHSTHHMLGAWIVIGLVYGLSTQMLAQETPDHRPPRLAATQPRRVPRR